MREIKFRCWDKNKKQMRAVRELCFDQYGTIYVHCECDDINEPAKGNDSLMQFTGLLDRHGKEIYEGDILQGGGHWSWSWDNKKFEVKYEDGKFYPWGTGDWEKDSDTYEIIGNVYESPELLTVK